MADLDDLDVIVEDGGSGENAAADIDTDNGTNTTYVDDNDVVTEVGEFRTEQHSRDIRDTLKSLDDFSLIVIMLVASCVEFVAAIVRVAESGFDPFGSWAFAGGLVAVVVNITFLVLRKVAADLHKKIAGWVALVMCIWWLSVAVPATFVSPFTTLSNGWIGCWLAFASTGMYMSSSFKPLECIKQKLQQQADSHTGKMCLILLIASVVVMISAIVSAVAADGTNDGTQFGLAVFAIVATIVTVVLVIVILVLMSKAERVIMILSIVIAVLWICAGFVGTFIGPNASFGVTGSLGSVNGFVGTWFALFAAMKLFQNTALDVILTKFGTGRSSEQTM